MNKTKIKIGERFNGRNRFTPAIRLSGKAINVQKIFLTRKLVPINKTYPPASLNRPTTRAPRTVYACGLIGRYRHPETNTRTHD